MSAHGTNQQAINRQVRTKDRTHNGRHTRDHENKHTSRRCRRKARTVQSINQPTCPQQCHHHPTTTHQQGRRHQTMDHAMGAFSHASYDANAGH